LLTALQYSDCTSFESPVIKDTPQFLSSWEL